MTRELAPPAPGDIAQDLYDLFDQIYGLLLGYEEHGAPVSLTEHNGTEYGMTIRNNESSESNGLRVYDSSDVELLKVRKAGVTVKPSFSVSDAAGVVILNAVAAGVTAVPSFTVADSGGTTRLVTTSTGTDINPKLDVRSAPAGTINAAISSAGIVAKPVLQANDASDNIRFSAASTGVALNPSLTVATAPSAGFNALNVTSTETAVRPKLRVTYDGTNSALEADGTSGSYVRARSPAGVMERVLTFGHDMAAGMIMAWDQATGGIPAGWALCDGTAGTPDLRGQGLMGYLSGDANFGTLLGTGGAKITGTPSTTTTLQSGTGVTAAGSTHTHTSLDPFVVIHWIRKNAT